jgi:hypothetical protein
VKRPSPLAVLGAVVVLTMGGGAAALLTGAADGGRPVEVLGEAITGGGVTAGAGAPDLKPLPISGSVADLYPGQARPLAFLVGNPNPFRIRITSVSVTPWSASAECTSANLSVGSFAGPFEVEANDSATTTVSVTMVATAPDACQGATFPVVYTAEAVEA